MAKIKTTVREKHSYYLESDKEICHFYRHCKKIKGELVEIDSEEYSRKYICNFNNNYQICKNCSKINEEAYYKTIIAVIAAGIAIAFFYKHKNIDIRTSKLWITSPSGRDYQIAHYQALRIVRKHNWHITETIPKISRWQAVKYILGMNVWLN